MAFGNMSAVAQLFFQPITENYLWGFMAQDVLGLWLPRIWTSLERGRIPYDESKDPRAPYRSRSAQRRHAWMKTIHGLNYWNGWEETAREVQNGPGIFIGQGFMYAGAAAWMMGKRGLLIGYDDLKQYFGQLGQVLTPEMATQLAKKSPQMAHRTLTQQYLTHVLQGHFGAPAQRAQQILELAKPMSQADISLLSKSEQGLYHWLKKQFPTDVAKSSLNYDKVLKKWTQLYSQLTTKGYSQRQLAPHLPKLENIFEELVCHYNTTVKKVVDPTQLDHFVLPKLPKLDKAVTTSARGFLNTLEKFVTVMSETLRLGRQYNALSTANASVPKLLNYLERHLILKKFPLSVIATMIGSTVVTYTAILSQSPKRKYPANRLIPIPHDEDQRLRKLFEKENGGGQGVVE